MYLAHHELESEFIIIIIIIITVIIRSALCAWISEAMSWRLLALQHTVTVLLLVGSTKQELP